MNRLEKRILLLAVMVVLAITAISMALATEPVGTGVLSQGAATRGTETNFSSVTAQGGNITELNISSYSVTDKWAGYYGQITGSITLETGSGVSFYNWSDASPTGEVFATRDNSPTWTSIACASAGNVGAESTDLELGFGLDNITETFCETCGNHSAFGVGSISFTADECTYRTNTFGNTGAQTTNWDQVLLYEGSNVVYTTLIDQDTAGFDGNNYDFQLLVGEDSNTSRTTTYYFFTEIA